MWKIFRRTLLNFSSFFSALFSAFPYFAENFFGVGAKNSFLSHPFSYSKHSLTKFLASYNLIQLNSYNLTQFPAICSKLKAKDTYSG